MKRNNLLVLCRNKRTARNYKIDIRSLQVDE